MKTTLKKTTHYLYHFRQYLGRNLTGAEAAVIGPLEKMRIRGLQRRLLVVDPPGFDSRGILCAYVEYLRNVYTPKADLLVMAQRKDIAEYVANRLKTPDAETYAATGMKPENIRGLNYSIALLLDIHDYGACSPVHEWGEFYRVARAVFPIISDRPDSLLILHARADVPFLHFWPALLEYTDPSLAPPLVPLKIPDPTVPVIIPLYIETRKNAPPDDKRPVRDQDPSPRPL